jgi:hypothetical protein
MTLREQAAEFVPALVREASRIFPGTLAAVDAFVPPWSGRAPASPRAPVDTTPVGAVTGLLRSHPATVDSVAALLGATGSWAEMPFRPSAPAQPPESPGGGARALLADHPATAMAIAAVLTR